MLLFNGLSGLQRVHLGEQPPAQGNEVFTGTPAGLIIHHEGDDPAWATFKPAGNPTAALVKE